MTDVAAGPVEAARARALRLAERHALATETLALPRAHGRVLARALATDGRTWLEAGQPLTPARVALAAGQGVATVDVSRRPTVAVFTMGDHLVMPGMPRAPGQAYDAARELLVGLLRADGLEPTAWPPLGEDPRQIEVALRDAGCAFDLIVVCGPPSSIVGDVVRVVAGFGELASAPGPDGPSCGALIGRLDEACVLGLPDDTPSALGLYASIGRALVDGLQRRAEPRPALVVDRPAMHWAGSTSPGWHPVRLTTGELGGTVAVPASIDASDADAILHLDGDNATRDNAVVAWRIA